MFNLQTSAGETFAFRIGEGETVYELPALRCLPASYALKMAQGAQEREGLGATEVFFELIEEYCPGLLDTLTLGDVQALAEAWQGDVSTGESQA